MTKIVERPDFFGTATFCDDIRQEINGKLIYIGVYGGQMIVNVSLPVTLSKLSVAIVFNQAAADFEPNISIKMFLPGDADDAPSVEAQLAETIEGAAKEHAIANSIGLPEEDRRYITMISAMGFERFLVKQPGTIRVFIDRRGVLYRIGSLRVVSAPPPQG